MGEHREVTDEKRPADRVVELFLFAPVGLAVSVKELLPGLVERGRQQVTNQVTMARMLGEYAVKHGRNALTGYLAVDSNAGSTAGTKAEGFGQMRLLELPRDVTVPGPGQVQGQFSSNTNVANQITIPTTA